MSDVPGTDVTGTDVTSTDVTSTDVTSTDVTSTDEVQDSTTTTTTTRRPARRRATRATAAPEGGAGESTATAEVAPEVAAEVAAPEPAPEAAAPESTEAPAKATRARRSRRATAPEPEPVVETPAETPEDEEPAEDADADAATGEVPALDVLAEFAGARTAAPKTRAAAPRLATTAVLFQAPAPTRSRRRAQAPAGPPDLISATAHREDGDEAAVEADGTAAPAASDDASEGTAPAPARRRRGRGKAAEEAVAELLEDVTETTEPAEDADAEAEDGEPGEEGGASGRRRRRRGGRGRRGRGGEPGSDEAGDEDGEPSEADAETESDADAEGESEGGESGSRRRRRRRRGSGRGDDSRDSGDQVTALRGSTRLEAKRQRRREGRDAGRRRQIITEAEFLARREAVERAMVVRARDGRTQIAVLEDGVLVEHYVSRQTQVSMAGNVYLGRVQNVLPSMEAAFVDIGKGRNAVLYAGEVNWDAAGLVEGQPRRIEQALKSGDSVLVQVTKDPIGHKGARLTSQVTLAGRYLVYVPGGGMTGISRKLPDTERNRLKRILREVVPDSAGVIVRTAAEGASEDELRADIARLQAQWEHIEKTSKTASAPALLQGEPDLAIRVVRDIFNDDFASLVVQGEPAWREISDYVAELAPDLAGKVSRWTDQADVFAAHRIDEQLAKGMDRKVWLPSGGSLVIDRTEAMTVIDVNTGKFTGAGGTLEETVTRNNLEAAEEIVRQLRLRDIGGIIVIDFIDMVLESNRDLVLRRLVEALGRDRTKHQVAEVTSLGLVQMTRKRVGQGLVEAFSHTCEHCNGRGFIVEAEPVEKPRSEPAAEGESKRSRRKKKDQAAAHTGVPVLPEQRDAVNATLATIAAAAAHAHELEHGHPEDGTLVEDELPGNGDPVTAEVGDAGETPVDESDLALVPVDPEVFDAGEADGEE